MCPGRDFQACAFPETYSKRTCYWAQKRKFSTFGSLGSQHQTLRSFRGKVLCRDVRSRDLRCTLFSPLVTEVEGM